MLQGPHDDLATYGDLAMLAFFVNKAQRLRFADDAETVKRLQAQHTQLLVVHSRVLAAQEAQVAREAASGLLRAQDGKLDAATRKVAAERSALLRDEALKLLLDEVRTRIKYLCATPRRLASRPAICAASCSASGATPRRAW